MFIGHFAVGFAAKRVAPRLSLAALFAAAQLADVMWPVLVGLGIEQVRIDPGNTAFTPLDFVSYPYSHSLVFLGLWGAMFGLICARVIHDRRIVVIAAALVVSHWVLDWITHRPDMPLYPEASSSDLGCGTRSRRPSLLKWPCSQGACGCTRARRVPVMRPGDGHLQHSSDCFSSFILRTSDHRRRVSPRSLSWGL
jgi:hypothetical protein